MQVHKCNQGSPVRMVSILIPEILQSFYLPVLLPFAPDSRHPTSDSAKSELSSAGTLQVPFAQCCGLWHTSF